MKRIITLNGIWEISYNGVVFDKKMKVPGNVPINKESYPEPENLELWYLKEFEVEKLENYKNAFLKFYGVDRFCRVSLNGKAIGEHTGGFDSFEFEIYKNLNPGKNILEIYVKDKPLTEMKNEIAGKQYWYGNSTGIWQDVELVLNGETFIKDLRFYLDTSEINVEAEIYGEWDYLTYTLYDGRKVILSDISDSDKFVVKPESIEPWSTEHPILYDLVIHVMKDGRIVDQIEKRTGFRKIEQIGDRIFLNGKPFYIKGLLDQDFYPETNYVSPSKEYIVDELVKIKKLGFNCSRYHVKTPMRDYVETCDALGVFLWLDLPYAEKLDSDSKKYLKVLRNDFMKRYSNNPSFMFLTLINESWGIDLNNPDEINWLKDFYEESDELINDRMIVDNSACSGNHHVTGKINDFHFYRSYPDHKTEWEDTIEKFASGEFLPFKIPQQFFTEDNPEYIEKLPETYCEKWRTLPKIVSEFGVWGLSDPALWSGNWGEYNFFEDSSVAKFKENTKELYAKTIYEVYLAAQWKQFWGLKHQIETMRCHSEISGFVLTELSDVSWEANGILDYSRNEKVFCPYLKMMNSEFLPMLKNNSRLFVSNISCTDKKMNLVVFHNGEKLIDIEKQIPAMSSVYIEDIDLSKKSGTIFLKLKDENGHEIGRNFYPLFNFESTRTFEIYDSINENVLARSEKGETVFVQLNEPGKYESFEVVDSSAPISGEFHNLNWNGDWISTFYYYHPSLRSLLNSIYGGQELIGATGPLVINGGKTLIGKFLGWNMFRTSCLSELKNGKGKIIVSTLDLKNTEIGQAICELLS